ncbi:SGNH hydrolase domain-containing protein [Bradyrhizobium elkanii]|uniref:SGNH hydrolase domain-containing protein n=1 Tax=Bradyrhizobium elkanii TaxID=29448 RepID=UPI0012FE434E|nr:SGNH hydrolase domain-containing protein [Bradyrhizobium elkanii]
MVFIGLITPLPLALAANVFLASQDRLNRDSVYFFSYGGCPPIPDLTDVQHPYCAGFVDAAKAAIRDKDIKTVVLGAHWWGYLNSASPYRYKDLSASKPDGRTGAINALTAMAKEFTQEGRTVYAIMNIPLSGLMSPPSTIRRKLTSFEIVPSPRSRLPPSAQWSIVRT